MEKFLYKVAQDLKNRIGKDLAGTAVIFPNKRAALFFNKYLVEGEDKPIWAPKYLTISELFREMRPDIVIPDTLELVCRLYNVYRKITEEKIRKYKKDITVESLDYFYQWGETLLSDFDDVDKNMANAEKLFTHLNDWNTLEASDFIDEEMESKIKQFFKGFSVDNMGKLRERFLEMWENLYDIYQAFNRQLADEGLAYEGALYRNVIETLDTDELPYENYVFVGFNVLDTVENKLFSALRDAHKALFYWDYDEKYMGDKNEAGMFLRHNLENFPNSLEQHDAEEEENPDEKEFVIISSKTNNIQAQYVHKWITEHLTEEESETAVVLCDEKQLQPVLHAIPDNVKYINVTMGYPLSETPAMSFVQCLVSMQGDYDAEKKAFIYKSAATLLKHPYSNIISANSKTVLARITKENLFYPSAEQLYKTDEMEEPDDILKEMFTPQTDNLSLCQYIAGMITIVARHYADMDSQADSSYKDVEVERRMYKQLYGESLFRIYTTITRFGNLIENHLLNVKRDMLIRLIERVLQGITIPFHGEPAVGLQIMGMLETRNLDFRNIIMLGVNEGMLPKSTEVPSFIPHTIRQGFGMTTIDRRIAVFAYYFYRLVQRSEKMYMIYNDENENGQKNEMSRFLLQLATENPNVRLCTISSDIQLHNTGTISIPRNEETLKSLTRRFECRTTNVPDETGWIKHWIDNHAYRQPRRNMEQSNNVNRYILSPTAINTYLDCQLKFYYKYVAGLKPKEDVVMDIDGAMFGTIFHNTAEEIYSRLTMHGNNILKSDITTLINAQNGNIPESDKIFKIEPIVDFYFRKEFFKQKELKDLNSYQEQKDKEITCPEVNYNGIQLINKEVILRLIMKLLYLDSNLGDFNYLGSEINVSRAETIPLSNGKSITVRIGGNIDRLDYVEALAVNGKSLNDCIRVIDYKTNAHKSTATSMESIFTPGKNRSGYHLQALMYSSILHDLTDGKVKIAPALLYIQKQNKDEAPILKIGSNTIDDIGEIKEEVNNNLRNTIADIFSSEGSFCQTEFDTNCQYCDFRRLCNR